MCYTHLELWRLGHHHRWRLGQQEERNASNSGTLIIHSNTMKISFIHSDMLVSLIQFRFICHSLRYAVSFFNNLDKLISFTQFLLPFVVLISFVELGLFYFIIHHFFVLIPVKQLSQRIRYFFFFPNSFNIFWCFLSS